MIWTQRFWIFTVFLAVLSDVGAIRVSIRQKLHETMKGSSATLDCEFQSTLADPRGLAIVLWSAVGTQPGDREVLIITHYHPTKVTDIKAEYLGRVALIVDIPGGRASLRLSSVTLADDKNYECRVMMPNDEEGNQADTTRLVVHEPVSNPICGIQGVARPGQNINLTCHSEEGSPPPLYAWERWRSRMGSQRQLLDRTATINGGVLSLHDISPETSGLYSCTSSNKIRMAACQVNLTVSHDVSQPHFFGAIAGVLAGGVSRVLTSIGSTADKVLLDVVNINGEQTPTRSP